jgi:ATP-dependent Clp protease adaptor protein ClpS
MTQKGGHARRGRSFLAKNGLRVTPIVFTFAKKNLIMNMLLNAGTRTSQEEEVEVLTSHEDPCSLIVWNDEVNTFEWVIQTLIEVCGHSNEQAEQCAMIIHTHGKYAVKHGIYEELKPQCDAITDRGIGATIEVIAE